MEVKPFKEVKLTLLPVLASYLTSPPVVAAHR